MPSLGIGMTHYPMLAGTDSHMADLLRWTLADPGIPESQKSPDAWPALMREEWGSDEGLAAAALHRHVLREDLARCRAALDEFAPDVVIVWGDDQYENFREEVVPPFCILAYPDTEVLPFEHMNELGIPNAWGMPDKRTITIKSDVSRARDLANDLLVADFDVAYSYVKRAGSRFPHAILNTQLFLAYDQAGDHFPYSLLPITVNCYGQHAIARRGGLARFADIKVEQEDPPGPSPRRCFDLGRAVARAMSARDLRVGYVASSSWSHAFLNDKAWHIWPDAEADERLYKAFQAQDWEAFSSPAISEIVNAGQHEMLNWFCLAGAASQLGLDIEWSVLRLTDVFNSNKCFAVLKEAS
jgi:Catalytic LigB subunit of aromatic ring-opening dioxygenase